MVGLLGRWGVGKTSILTMLAAELNKADSKRLVVTFSPWFYDDPRAMTLAFYGLLKEHLTNSGLPSLVEAGKALGALGEATGAVSSSVTLFDPAAGSLAKSLSTLVRGAGAVLERLGGAASGLNSARRWADEALTRAGREGSRVIVLIDDVDRLSYDELMALFRVVRAVADLPAVSIVLAIDEERVRGMLEHSSGDTGGGDYLDKIVQVKVHVPAPARPLLRAEIDRRLAVLFERHHAPHPEELKEGSLGTSDEMELLQRLLHTPRDVVRFVNSLSVLMLGVGGDRIDVLDATVLSGLDVYCPEGYAAIRDNRALFAGPEPGMMSAFREREDGEYQAEYESLLGTIDPRRSVLLEAVVEYLFGNVRTKPGSRRRTLNYGNRWRRIEDPVHFDTYFSRPAPNVLTEPQTTSLFGHLLSGEQLSAEASAAVSQIDEVGVSQLKEDLDRWLNRPLTFDPGSSLERLATLLPLVHEGERYKLLWIVAALVVRRRPDASDDSWCRFFTILRHTLPDFEDFPKLVRQAMRSSMQAPAVWATIGREWLADQERILAAGAEELADEQLVDLFVEARLLAEALDGATGRSACARLIGRFVASQPRRLPDLLTSVSASSGTWVGLSSDMRSASEARASVMQHFESESDVLAILTAWQQGGYSNDPHRLVEELAGLFPAAT